MMRLLAKIEYVLGLDEGADQDMKRAENMGAFFRAIGLALTIALFVLAVVNQTSG